MTGCHHSIKPGLVCDQLLVKKVGLLYWSQKLSSCNQEAHLSTGINLEEETRWNP